MDESALIHAANQGDLESFNQLVLEYQDLVYQRAFWILHEKQSADDAAQEAFIKAYLNLSRFRSGSFRAWILRIVTNTCYDELRRRKRSRQVSFFHHDPEGDETDLLDFLVDPDSSTEKTIEQAELQADLYRQIDKLPQEFRQTLLLVDIHELTYEDAASVLGVPLGTVKSRLARARMRLRKQITAARDLTPESHLSTSVGVPV
jgi:RNA polymerase sigma-70 factor (ECF subfamily)